MSNCVDSIKKNWYTIDELSMDIKLCLLLCRYNMSIFLVELQRVAKCFDINRRNHQ